MWLVRKWNLHMEIQIQTQTPTDWNKNNEIVQRERRKKMKKKTSWCQFFRFIRSYIVSTSSHFSNPLYGSVSGLCVVVHFRKKKIMFIQYMRANERTTTNKKNPFIWLHFIFGSFGCFIAKISQRLRALNLCIVYSPYLQLRLAENE